MLNSIEPLPYRGKHDCAPPLENDLPETTP